MLNISPEERNLLNASGALATDQAGEEILAGLTVEESEFVLRLEKQGADQLPSHMREHFLALRIQHRKARIILSSEKLNFMMPPKPPHNDGHA